ncbi:MAG: phosphoglycerate kinase [Bacillota bacterium]|nr:phosphoglycerate kinase [Bacillota bacterium]
MGYLEKRSIRDIDARGKRVIVRVDFNVPVKDGKVKDTARITAALPTIRFLLEQGAAVILMSHLGRPDGKPDLKYTLRPVAEKLAELIGQPVAFAADCVGAAAEQAAAALHDGELLLLENLRFHAEEEANDPAFARQLAALADIYVNDAFGTAHRAHASTEGIGHIVPAVAGFLIEKEIRSLGMALADPDSPFVAIIGGAKVSDKILVIENLLKKVDKLLLGGGMANTFLAAQGHDMQASLVEEPKLEWAREFLATDIAKQKLLLPADVVAASAFAADADYATCNVDNIPAGWQALDIGPKSLKLFATEITAARTILWNGPVGVFEMEPFAIGTTSIARKVAESAAFSIIGGGDSVAAVHKAGVEDLIDHISTGGGASLNFLEGKTLPGIAVLADK